MQSKYVVSFLLFVILFISSCSTSIESSEDNPNQCYEDITKYVKENPSLNLDLELEKYCGSEKVKDYEIKINPATGYKHSITLNYEGHKFDMAYYPDLREAMIWLKENTDKNEKIMTWWDYGTMINVFADRNVVSAIPSKQALKYIPVASSWQDVKLQDDKIIKDIALIFTTNNFGESVSIMKQYNTKYLLIPRDIAGKFPILYELVYGKIKFINLDQTNSGKTKGEDLDTESMTYRALTNKPISGFKQVYSDDGGIIYQIIE